MSMIERCVDAAGNADWRFTTRFHPEEQRRIVQAIIEALREPTEAMLDEGPSEPYMDRDVWAKMIDKALT